MLGLLPPVPVYFHAVEQSGYAKLGVTMWGFPFSVIGGAVIGLMYGFVVSRARRRAGQLVRTGPVVWPCLGMGALASLMVMIAVAIVLANTPGRGSGWVS